MTSSAPQPIAWLIIGFGAMAAVLRLVLLHGRSRPSERQVTYALISAVVAAMLRERAVQHALADVGVLSVGFTRQLGTTFIVLAFAPLTVVTESWSERWSEQASASYRRMSLTVWCAVVVSMVSMLLLGSHARALGQYIDRTEGWQTVAYFAFFSVWCAATGELIVSASVREMRAGQLRPSHRFTYALLVLIGGWALEEAVSSSSAPYALRRARDMRSWTSVFAPMRTTSCTCSGWDHSLPVPGWALRSRGGYRSIDRHVRSGS